MNKIKTKLFITTFLLFGLILMPSLLCAEPEIMLLENDVEIQTIPENPEPYSNVTIKLISYATDLNKAMIEWRSGSTIVLSGYGKTSYYFETFGPNSATVFDITITPSNGVSSVSKQISIIPSEVELFWEAINGYTPPFYKGKSFVSREGTVKVVAIPNTNVIKQGKGNISYTWKSNDKTDQGASGYNKDSYIIQNKTLNDTETISVLASSIDNKYNAIKTIDIPMVNPKIIFYKKSPTEGVIYGRALVDDDFVTEDEITIVAEPYFLAYVGNEYDFDFNWKINGQSIAVPPKKTEITVRPSSRGGYATISLSMENLKMLFQEVSGGLKLNL